MHGVFYLVEARGVEPLSEDPPRLFSTSLSYFVMSPLYARKKQTFIQSSFLKSRHIRKALI